MERIVLNQENYTVKEIYQDFYMFLAEYFTPLGYKYRKSKHDMYKNIENFRVVFDYQTFSWNCLGDEIEIFIHKKIEFKDGKGEWHWFFVNDINGADNILSEEFNIKNIDKEYLQVLLNEAIEYINYMELTVKKLLNGEELGIHTFELFDPYKKYEYVESGLEEKYTTCLDKSGIVKTVDWEGLNKHPWYDYYTEASVKKVYNSFCKYFKEEYEKKITKK
ncbi:hypothetical protein [Fusobacterium animalis]|uniref:DUF4304 domain-containing protein n=1 Tax=Fusobacterium animalis TaxID=76859 RepID=A0A2B7YW89_9FUSO|nr:hypothetical protein [Fusobacterium animalis]PGH25253.1 hypothetical protein RN90_07485 [Fusobacterium animalis]